MTEVAAMATSPHNPYVGPRAFRQDDLEFFFGRRRETARLVSSLIAGRIVLLHSPSGAGKTSLLQASVVPHLAGRGFAICATRSPRFSALRVNAPPPEGFRGNRYVHSVVLGLMGEHVDDREQLRSMSIAQALDYLGNLAGAARQLVVLDQFEEILTAEPGDLVGQRDFFEQLGEALDDPRRWAIVAMREDFMGGLDRYLRYIPGQLRTTFRLDLLDVDGALQAIQKPAEQCGVVFEDEAARELVADLRMVDPSTPGRGAPDAKGSYVTPVLLQVVCDNLWQKLSSERGTGFVAVTAKDVAGFRPIDVAIDNYYSRVVRKAARGDLFAERIIRDWVQERLLTSRLLRAQTMSQPDPPAGTRAMEVMMRKYLIREDPRAGSWYELTHDMLIRPIVRDNERWRETTLAPWQLAAYRWHRERFNKDRYLISGSDLRVARATVKKAKLTDFETAFLQRCITNAASETKRERLEARADLVTFGLVASVAVNVILLVLIIAFHF